MSYDKFIQPDVVVIKRSRTGVILPPERIAEAAAAVRLGADVDEVALQLAIDDLFLRADVELRELGGPGSGNFGHAGRPGQVGGSATELQNGAVLNGVALTPDPDPDFTRCTADIPEPPLHVPPGMHVSAGVIMLEPDGRVWLYEPTGHYGGYVHTFAKGTVEEGEGLQETAARETWEETGLVPKIEAHLIDVSRTTSVARFYVGRRIGGSPTAHGDEAQSVRLLPIHGRQIEKALLNVGGHHTSDHKVLDALRAYVEGR